MLGETGDARTNHPDASAETVRGSGKQGNGASPFEYDLLHALQAMRVGDFSVRMPGDQDGMPGKIADAFNEIAAANQRIAQQLERVGDEVGREGRRDSASSSACPMAPGARWRIPSTP